jgi:long-chain acyl-CoA synthetase
MSSLVSLLVERATAHPTKVALRHRRLGIWTPITWSEYAAEVLRCADGLRNLGVKAGDRVGVLMENDPTLLYSFLGAQALGAVAVGIRPDTSPNYIGSVIVSQAITSIVVGNQEQFDKVVTLRADNVVPNLRTMVIVNTRGIRNYENTNRNTDDGIHTWLRFPALRSSSLSDLGELARGLNATDTGAVVMALDGSGTALSHQALADAASKASGAFGLKSVDETMAIGSLVEPNAMSLGLLAPLASSIVVNIGQDSALVLRELPEVRPTVLVAPSALLEGIKGDVDVRASKTKGLKKLAYQATYRRGASRAATRKPRAHNKPVLLVVSALIALIAVVVSNRMPQSAGVMRWIVPLGIGLVFALGVVLLGFSADRPVRNRYGLGGLRLLAVETKGLTEATADWMWRFGVPLSDPPHVLSLQSSPNVRTVEGVS